VMLLCSIFGSSRLWLDLDDADSVGVNLTSHSQPILSLI